MNSVWRVPAEPEPGFAALDGRVDADVAIVGGGIAGTTTALLLSEAGLTVALVEAGRIGAGNTGRSTGNLYGTVARGLQALRRKWDEEVVREAVRLRLEAMELVEGNVRAHGIDCAFARVPQYIGVESADEQQWASLEEEFSALDSAGLAPSWCAGAPPLPFAMQRTLKIERQAQLNPFLYTRGLASALARRGARVFERSRVVDIDAGGGRVRTGRGEIRASAIVLATHSPIGFNLVQAEMQPCIEYGISARLRSGSVPPGIFWIRDGSHSLRRYRQGGIDYLVVVGQTHKTGEPEEGAAYLQRLRDFAQGHFDVAGFEHGWSAQQFRPADGLPYIGPSAHRNVFIATGFAADGLTWGTVAASLISRLVRGEEDDSAATRLLSPWRLTPVKSGKAWAEENATVVKHLVGDRLGKAEAGMLSAVAPGEGRIVAIEGRKYAVHRDEQGALTVLSPVCPHLKCHVSWNAEHPGWDCPCHGSRFHPDGRVFDGPAMSDLERFPVEQDVPGDAGRPA